MMEATIEQAIASSTPAGLPATSLIICSRNRPELLAESIDSILKGDEVPTQLIIVDQSKAPHPTLATLTTDRTSDIRYLWTQSVGLSRANNTGIAAAQHDLLVFTHDDVIVSPVWFGALVHALLAGGPRSVVTGQVRAVEADTPNGFAPSTKVDESPAVYEGRIGADPLYPMNMAMYRSTIDEVGGFDEHLGPGTSYPAAEDNEFGYRLLEAGYRIIYVPEAVLFHRAWRAEREYLPLRWSYGRGQGAFYAKHLGLTDRYIPRRMSWDIMRHIYQATWRLRRQPRLACGDVIYILGMLSGAAQWLLTQRRTR